MGEIFLADDTVTGAQAVLKVLRTDVLVDDATARFEHEIEVLRALRDPRVWEAQRVVAVVFVEGMSTAEMMSGLKRALPLSTALFLIVDVLQALHRAHSMLTDDGAPRGLVHRDVSPTTSCVTRAGADT